MSAFLFDFDGTLVDTMPLHYAAYRKAFAEYEVDLSEQDFYPNLGGNARETIPLFLRGRACSGSLEELHRRKKQLIGEAFRTQPITVLETAKLLPLLGQAFPVALASSGSREGIEIVLDRLKWRPYFQAIVTADDVAAGKPAPDLFLRAAELLGVAPATCFVFEDTDAGVGAARAAGMQWFDVRNATVAGRSTT